MEFQILDIILLPELKVQHERLLLEEQGLSLEEKQEKNVLFSKHAERIYFCANVARREGLLALDEIGEKMNPIPGKEMIQQMINLIVDGSFPEEVTRVSLMKYFSTKKDSYHSIIDIMSIYGFMSIQAGVNPRIICLMLQNMVPGGSVGILSTKKTNFNGEDGRKVLEKFYQSSREGIEAVTELEICEKVLLAMDNRFIQRVLREISDNLLFNIIGFFSEKVKQRIFQNLSERKVDDMVRHIWMNIADDQVYFLTDHRRIKSVNDDIKKVLKTIYLLEMAAEIVIGGEQAKILSEYFQ